MSSEGVDKEFCRHTKIFELRQSVGEAFCGLNILYPTLSSSNKHSMKYPNTKR